MQRRVLVAKLRRRETESFVPAKRPTDRSAHLFAIKARHGLGSIERGRQTLEMAIAFEQKGGSVNFVGPGARDDVDNAVSGAANLGSEASRGDLKLGDGIFREVRKRPTDNLIVIVGAIDEDVAPAPKGTGRADFNGVGLGRVEVGRRAIAWQQEGKLKKIAPVERNALDGCRGNLALQHGLRDIHLLLRVAVHVNNAGLRGDMESRLQGDRSARIYLHVAVMRRGKTGGGEIKRVAAGGNVREKEVAFRVSVSFPNIPLAFARGGNAHTAENAAARVRCGAPERA